jgi:Met-zincin/Domain of unknown function (DUF5117)
MKTRISMGSAALTSIAFTLAGCATAVSAPVAPTTQPTPTPAPAGTAPAAATAAAPGAAPAATPPRPAPLPGALTAFAEVTREAKRADGWLPVWTREDRTWLEIPVDRLDKPFFLGSSVASGLGQSFFYPGLQGRSDVVVLKRVGNTVQLIARNMHPRAPEGTPLARAVAESYSDSLLGAAPLAAAPHLQSKALLVDAAALLGGDLSGIQTALERAHRMPYALDRGNSHFERVRPTEAGTYFTLRQHFSVPRLPVPPVAVPGAPPPNPATLPNPPYTLPDARSLFIAMTYTLAPLPATPMKVRKADPRVGYFTDAYADFSDDSTDGRRTHLINRWRLEKKDPAAAVSEPKEPIRVVMDRNIPEKWRAPLREGVLEWNKAFEQAGFKNAIALEQQAEGADWTSLEGTRMLSVRWFALEGPGAVAVGPSESDPRTGEILRGASIIPENWVRIFRSRAIDTEPKFGATAADAPPAPAWFAKPFASPFDSTCTHAAELLGQAQMAFDLLTARGAFDPNSPAADKYIAQALKDVTMHEVGHALGLRHNFRASVNVTPAQLRDPAFTATRGLSNSVMDYNALNVPLEGERVADYHQTTIGAYDYWAINFGYREFASADEEKRELARLAAMGERDPNLAYASDEDVFIGTDPLVNQRDLTNDPLAFAQRQNKLARELWQHTVKRQLDADDDLTIYRRNLQRVLTTLGSSMPVANKYLGGTYTRRVTAGTNEPLLVPVPAQQQRAALDMMLGELFNSASFKFEPRIMSRLGTDLLDRFGPNRNPAVEFSLPSAVLDLQRPALDSLMSDGLAAKLANAEAKVEDPRTLLNFAEVQQRLTDATWSELANKKAIEIDSFRRNLQREHVKRLAAAMLRPSSPTAADVRPVMRQAALALQSRLASALAGSGGKASGAIVKAHLEDSLATLSEALKAPLVKQGA